MWHLQTLTTDGLDAMTTDRQVQGKKVEMFFLNEIPDNLEDLQDILAMMEALEAPEEESMTLEEYERLRLKNMSERKEI